MAYEKRDNSGSLFKNDRKEAETHADYRGEIRINGHDYWLNAWLKDGKSGKFFSLSVKPKDGTAARPEKPERDYSQSDFAKSARARQQAFDAQAPAKQFNDDTDLPF